MVKTKRNTAVVLTVMFMLVLSVVLTVAFTGSTTAYAAATPKYTMTFDYTHYYHYNTTNSSDGSATNVTSASMKHTQSGTTTVKLYIYGTASSDNGTLAKGGTIGSSGVNITLESAFANNSIKVTNSSGAEVGSGKTNLSLSSLADGKYNVSVGLTGSGWNPNARAYAWYSAVLTTSFSVDTTPPVITGASASATGKYTKSAFTVSASDALGSATLFCASPGSSNYIAYGTSRTVETGSKNGLYRFYARDSVGNTSSTYYVYYDNTAPTGTVRNASNVVILGNYTNGSFSYTGSDSGSGISYLQYKTPSSGSWTSYTAGTQIKATATNGIYQFRAVDKAGNISDIKSMTLDTAKPTGTLYGGTSVVSNGSATDAEYIRFVASDGSSGIAKCYVKEPGSTVYKEYISGSQYAAAGTYSFYCTDNAGNVSQTYMVTVERAPEHSYIVNSKVNPTCTAQGYTVYRCTDCGDTYNADYVPALGHAYKTEIVGAGCVSGGYTKHTCTRCGAGYTTNSVAAKGHSYAETVVTATCTENGYTLHKCSGCGDEYVTDDVTATGHTFTETARPATCTESGCVLHSCTVCGYAYETDVKEPSGHSYATSVVSNSTCTENGHRHHACEKCGDEYDTNIPATGHNYQITHTQSENGITTRIYTCTVCGDAYTQEMGDQYEKVTSYVEYLFEQYAPYMWWVLLATAGVWSIAMGVAIVVAHKNEDKEKAKKMLVNYLVGLVVIAAIVVACPYLIRGIAVLVT